MVAENNTQGSIEFAPALSGFPWYALQVRARHEWVTQDILAGKGYEVYVPSYQKLTRWSDRIQPVNQPLFPGYMFCRFDANRRLPVLTTHGVISVIAFGGSPARLDLAEIDAVRKVVTSKVFAEPCPYVRVGDRVRIKKGPLAGMEGILLSRRNKWRFVISVSLLQQSVSTEIDCEML